MFRCRCLKSLFPDARVTSPAQNIANVLVPTIMWWQIKSVLRYKILARSTISSFYASIILYLFCSSSSHNIPDRDAFCNIFLTELDTMASFDPVRVSVKF